MSEPYYSDPMVTLYHGRCEAVMPDLEPQSVDAIVTDPPYGLGFMGKAWDDLPPGLDFAHEALRALKPGGHLLAFGGTRTWHRLAVAVEDAGFEIRDSIAWLYGSGFPKSLDVSKAIDKAAGAEREVVGRRGGRYASGYTPQSLATTPGGLYRWGDQHFAWDDLPANAQAYFVGVMEHKGDITAPATDAARQWSGWGTALKPAFEPIVVARKPLTGTVAQTVLAHGTGALNIDATRIAHGADVDLAREQRQHSETSLMGGLGTGHRAGHVQPLYAEGGRWPANVVLDPDAAAELDEQSGESTAKPHRRNAPKASGTYGAFGGDDEQRDGPSDSGGASRFFYTAKADSGERITHNGVAHPTVKPLSLMRWLVRLVTPPGGLILEPFAGSGTTVEAALLEGFRCIAIEREADYLPLITQRIHRRRDPVEYLTAAGEDLGLFGEAS